MSIIRYEHQGQGGLGEREEGSNTKGFLAEVDTWEETWGMNKDQTVKKGRK